VNSIDAYLNQVVLDVFDRAGTPVGPGESALDERLAKVAALGTGLFCRAVEDEDSWPLPVLCDLLTTVAALRAVLGMTPTPVNAEVYLAMPETPDDVLR
jgi:hypothetical protein